MTPPAAGALPDTEGLYPDALALWLPAGAVLVLLPVAAARAPGAKAMIMTAISRTAARYAMAFSLPFRM
jgi:hypothetical protein